MSQTQVQSGFIGDNTVTPAKLSTGGPSWNTAGTLTATSFNGNATSATTFNTNRGNYRGITDGAVAGQLMWKNYGNNHTIFDASQSTSPDGGGVNNTNSQVAWTGSYPTLMGWNGANTYGVRVDSARVADTAGSVTNGVYTTNFSGSNQSLSANGYQKLPGGLIMQWGSFTNPTTISNLTITFPTPFTTACWSVQINVATNPAQGAPADGTGGLCVPLPSKTSFVAALRTEASTNDWTYYWFAVGV